MTTISPKFTWCEYTADVRDAGGTWYPLPVTNIVASEDMDRESYTAVTLTLEWVSEAIWELLDARAQSGITGPDLRWRVAQYTRTAVGVVQLLGYLPGIGLTVPDQERPASMYLRDANRDLETGTVTVIAAGGETMLGDKTRNSATTIDTRAADVSALVQWSLFDVFGGVGGGYAADPIVLSTAIPAGDRRLMLQGESHIDLMKSELDAINCRLYDVWGLSWSARVRDIVAGTIKLATHPQAEGAPADADPIVWRVTEKVTRDGAFADGVLIRYDYLNAAGVRVTTYQASGGGVNTKGLVVQRQRAMPAANAAEQLLTRTRIRGRDITVVARIRLDLHAANAFEIHTTRGVLTGVARAVQWDCAAGTVTIRAQSGLPGSLLREQIKERLEDRVTATPLPEPDPVPEPKVFA